MKKEQPQIIVPRATVSEKGEEFDLSHLEGSRDEEIIRKIVQEANTIDISKFDLKQVCQGVMSSQM